MEGSIDRTKERAELNSRRPPRPSVGTWRTILVSECRCKMLQNQSRILAQGGPSRLKLWVGLTLIRIIHPLSLKALSSHECASHLEPGDLNAAGWVVLFDRREGNFPPSREQTNMLRGTCGAGGQQSEETCSFSHDRSTTPFKLPALRSGFGLLLHYPINRANDAFTTSRAVGDKLEGQDG